MAALKRRRVATAPTCTVPGHEHVKLVCPACVGARGAGVPKPASARNGKLGGRPKLPPHNLRAHAAVQDTSLRKLAPGCGRCRSRAEKLKHVKEMLTPAPQIDAAGTVAAIHRARRTHQ